MVQTKEMSHLEKIKGENLGIELIPGITLGQVNKLHKNGINNLIKLACYTVQQLISLGISRVEAENLITKACRITDKYLIGRFGFVAGDILLRKYEEILTLSSGCVTVDEILDGGFKTQYIYDIYGRENSGKSSLMHQLICRSFLPVERGGLGTFAAIYIDTEGSFSLNRIKKIAPFYGLYPIDVLRNTYMAMPPTSDVLSYLIMNQLEPLVEQTGAKIVVIDALSTHFFSEYGDDKRLFPEMRRKILALISCLKNIAINNNVLILITNHMTDNPIQCSWVPYINALKLCTEYDAHYSIRLGLYKDIRRRFLLERAIDLPHRECELLLTEFGFLDVVRHDLKSRRKNHRTPEPSNDDLEEDEFDGE